MYSVCVAIQPVHMFIFSGNGIVIMFSFLQIKEKVTSGTVLMSGAGQVEVTGLIKTMVICDWLM